MPQGTSSSHSLSQLCGASHFTVHPHEEIWFEDGNVLLIAESTSFRVHKSILARHSEFFHDMFKLPQPSQIAGSFNTDGMQCPTVDTSESAEDLAHFLSIIYDSIKLVQFHLQIPLICFPFVQIPLALLPQMRYNMSAHLLDEL